MSDRLSQAAIYLQDVYTAVSGPLLLLLIALSAWSLTWLATSGLGRLPRVLACSLVLTLLLAPMPQLELLPYLVRAPALAISGLFSPFQVFTTLPDFFIDLWMKEPVGAKLLVMVLAPIALPSVVITWLTFSAIGYASSRLIGNLGGGNQRAEASWKKTLRVLAGIGVISTTAVIVLALKSVERDAWTVKLTILDQYSEPVEDAGVAYISEVGDESKTDVVFTGQDGVARLYKPVAIRRLCRFGYELETARDQISFTLDKGAGSLEVHAWKREQTADLHMYRNKRVQLADGDMKFLKLYWSGYESFEHTTPELNELESYFGDISVRYWRQENEAGQGVMQKMRVVAMRGGFIETDDIMTNLAPLDGYVNPIEFEEVRAADDQSSLEGFGKRRFYFMSHEGRHYGLLEVALNGNGELDLTWKTNTQSSPILTSEQYGYVEKQYCGGKQAYERSTNR